MRAHKELRKQRQRLSLTQEEIATALGVDQAYVSQLETGRRKPSLDIATLIEELLGVEATAWARINDERED